MFKICLAGASGNDVQKPGSPYFSTGSGFPFGLVANFWTTFFLDSLFSLFIFPNLSSVPLHKKHRSYSPIILGRSLKGSDGFFPHESIRDLLEQLNNDKVDLEVYTGYVNSRGARWVRDGSDQLQLGKQFEQQSHSLEITHPHTAAVLRFIAQDYKREALYDHLHAELDP